MRASINTVISVSLALLIAGCGGSGNNNRGTPPTAPPAGLSTGPSPCVGGVAGSFGCSGIALRARLPLQDMQGAGGNDIWGWADPVTGNEYALMGLDNGTAFVDVSDPENPVFVGRLPTATRSSVWRDIKVYQDHAYVVADNAGAHGMQVFDLTRLRGATPPQSFAADIVYGDFGNAHNLAINEETGFAYAVGTNTCGGGLHMIDITTPDNPMFAGCHASAHTHDTQCVVYRGPDADHANSEICASSNENHVEIADVTVKFAPVSLAVSGYPQLGFVHQGWLTEDHRFFLVGDELDEANFGVATRTHVFDLADLDNPDYLYAFELPTGAIDHNLYVLGNRVYEANYTSGLRILEFGDLASGQISEIAWFDTFPASGGGFDGAWSVFPYLPSGNIIVSDISNGLFVLTPQ